MYSTTAIFFAFDQLSVLLGAGGKEESMWNEPVRKKALIDRNIPPAVIDQFEEEHPESVTKINPLKRNSPKLYDLKVFDAWWDKRIRTQVQAKRMFRA